MLYLTELNSTQLVENLTSCQLQLPCQFVSYYVVIFTEQGTQLLAALTSLKSQLSELIEPDFGLLDQLLSLEVLTRRQYTTIRSERTAFDRTDAVLDLATTEDHCCKLFTALEQTQQQHVINLITQNESKTNNDLYYFVAAFVFRVSK